MADVNTALIDSYLQTLWDREGTDVLIVAGAPPLMRLDGEIVPLDERPLRPEDTGRLVRGVLAGELWDDFQHDREIDFSFNWEGQARFRGNAYHQRGSVALSLRLIPYRIPTFADLGLPAVLASWVDLPQGLILVTGPTGAGKSTTLAAMIDCGQPATCVPHHHHRGPAGVRAPAQEGGHQPAGDRARHRVVLPRDAFCAP